MAYQSIIGREEEIKKLDKFLKSPKSEFVAIYGRRRVGKSYLVEEVYKDKIVFRAVGAYIKEKDERTYKQNQLDHFYESLLDQGVSEDTPRPSNWREAFRLLRKYLEGLRTRRRVVFLDELPWLAGPQSSELITELGLDRFPNETTIRFLSDGTMTMLVRTEQGNKHGMWGVSRPPYTEWEWTETNLILGGPDYLVLNDTTLAVGTRSLYGSEKMMLLKGKPDGKFEEICLYLPAEMTIVTLAC
jgi:hypothetical protein